MPQPAEPLGDIAGRLLHDGVFVVTYLESPKPRSAHQYPSPARVSCLTPKGEAALDYADAVDRLVLDAYARVRAAPGDVQIIWRRRGQPVDPAELEPCFEGLVARGYLRPTASGYALTPAGEAAVAAGDPARPARTGRSRVTGPSGIDRATRDQARELARRRRQEALTTAEQRRP